MSRNQKRRKKQLQRKKENIKNQKMITKNQKNILNAFKLILQKRKDYFILFFKKLKEKEYLKNIFVNFFNDIVSYVKSNKRNTILASTLIAVVVIGYFAIVWQPSKNEILKADNMQASVSLDLSDDVSDYVDNAQTELSVVTQPTTEIALNDNDASENVVEVSTETVAKGVVDNLVDSEVVEEEQITVVEEVVEVDNTLEKVILNIKSSQRENTEIITSHEISYDQIALIREPKEEILEFSSVTQSIKLGIDMYAIEVNGKEEAYVKTLGEANIILDRITNIFRSEDVVEERIGYLEKVEIVKIKRDIIDFEGYKDTDSIIEYILKGTNEQRIHKVVSGENFWVIANHYGLPVEDLIDANPNIDEKRLAINTELSLIVSEPIINVVIVSKRKRVDEIPYGKEENIMSNDYYVGTYKVKVSGVPGEANVIVEEYFKNGKLFGEKVIESSIVKDPVNKVVYQGTKPAPPKIGTGNFSRPTSRGVGVITSRFGPRNFGDGWHDGLDIGLSMNTDIKAADGGVVIYAGWKGSYGRVVIINHGGLMETRYAHLNVIKVSPGDSVFKGQLIALSGNSGRSTGPHLHFEVRKNNVPINPINYVNY